jgi:predicted MFS family arabinose efflux permease
VSARFQLENFLPSFKTPALDTNRFQCEVLPMTERVQAPEMERGAEKRLIWLLFAVQFTNILDYVIMMPLGPRFLRVFHISPAQFGLLVSAYAISAGICGLIAALYLDHFDRKHALLFLYGGFGLGTFFCAIAPNFWMLLAARVIAGGFGGVVGAVVLAIVADIVPDYRRGAAMGLVMSTFSVASVLGVPFGLYLANLYEWHAPFFLLSGLAFALCGVVWKMLPALRSHIHARAELSRWSQLFQLLRQRSNQVSLLFFGVLIAAAMMVVPYITAYLVENTGMSEKQLPYVYLCGGACTMFSMNWVGRLSDRFGRPAIYFIMLLSAVAATLILTNMPPAPLWMLLAVTTLYMVCSSGRIVPAMAMITASVAPSQRGSFMSVNASVQHLSSGLGAYAAGLFISQKAGGPLVGYSKVGWISAVVALSTLWIVRFVKPWKP